MPLKQIIRQWADRKKIVHEPLFTSYVFVRVAENDQRQLLNTNGVVNMVYWLGKPAVIRDLEIDMIQRFLGEHLHAILEKSPVNVHDMVRVIGGPLLEQEGKVVAIKSKTVKIILPSLGYVMSAEVERVKVEVIQKRLSHLKGIKRILPLDSDRERAPRYSTSLEYTI